MSQSRKWTAERRARYEATIRSRQRSEPQAPRTTRVSDAINYLRHAEKDIAKRIRAGKLREQDTAHLYMQLALKALLGEQA